MPERQVSQTLCRMCDDHCALNIYTENGKIIDIDGYLHHPWNRGRVCSKSRAAVDMIYHKDRILKPLKKTDNGWQEIPLEQALDEIARKLIQVKEKYETRSISIWKGEAIGFAQQEEIARRFIHALGTPNYFSNDSQCYNGRYFGYKLVEGAWPVPDYYNSRCIVLWGANPPNAHPNMTQMIMAARKKGAKLIVIDPRLASIARQADIYAPVKPGTDGALVWGVINLLIENNWYNRELVEKYVIGFEKFAEYAKRFTLDFVSEETGVNIKIIEQIANTMAKSSPKVVNYVGNGPEHHENGINNIRAMACLDALLGALDVKGGNVIAEGPGLNRLTLYDEIPLRRLLPIGSVEFPVLYDLRQECHTMTAMDTILNESPYPIKAMILTGANPVITNPNSNKVKKALASLDLFVVRDLFMTETAELADYVLPAASFLERSELHCHPMFQVITLTKKIFSIPEVQDEYEFWHDMAHRLGIGDYFPWENETELNKWLLEPTGITLEELEKHPEGYRYKPIQHRKYENIPFNTPSGKIEFTSDYLKDLGYEEVPEYKSPTYITKPNPEYPYVLITGARKLLYYHSRNQNIPRFRTADPRVEVEIHPNDAKKLSVLDGDMVKVTSTIGSICIPVKIKAPNEIREGNLQITHGFRESNVNEITHDDRFDPISGFPLMKSMEVKVEKI